MENLEVSGIAIITGGTSGIALGASKELIGNGDICALVLVYLSDLDGAIAAKKELLAMMEEKLKSKNIEPEVMSVQGDISKQETVDKIFEAVESLVTKRNLKLKVVVHSAGTGRPGKHQKLGDGSMFQEDETQKSIDFEDYDFYQSVYPKAFIRLLEASLQPHLRPSSDVSLSIVAVSSPGSNSTQQVPNSTAYDLRGPAKCTLESLVRFYAKRLAAKNVTVNCVIPGVVLTKAWKNITPANMKTEDLVDKVTQSLPMKRPADAREIGAAIAFLCSDKARYITGVALSVDGGAHLGF